FVLFFVGLGLSVVLIGMRSGRTGPLLDPQRKGGRRAVAVMAAVIVLVFGVGLPIATAVDNADAPEQAGPVDLNAQEVEGRRLFNRNCVQCHTLGASASVQRIGPNLDVLRPPPELTLDAIANGRARGQGQMPAGLVTGEQAEAVAAYVAKVAGRVD